jgi:hypothetical protein
VLLLLLLLAVAGHAVVLVGYDNDNMAWLALNSWVRTQRPVSSA